MLHQILEESRDIMGRTLAEKWAEDGRSIWVQMSEARGIKIGEARGIAEGEYRKAVITAKNMLSDNLPILTISKYTGLSIAEINKIKSGF